MAENNIPGGYFADSVSEEPQSHISTVSVPASLPATTKFAVQVARKWQNVPDTIGDDDALVQGLITPEMLQLIMQIIQQLMQNCIPNARKSAWQRVRSYLDSNKPLDKIGDQARLNGLVKGWLTDLGIQREPGDVVLVRRAIEQVAAGTSEQDFYAVQTEIIWLTI